MRIRSAMRSAFSASMFAAAFSTSDDDVAHAEDAAGDAAAGWNSSSASIFSPVPISLIGLPVTARIDSAAPPRPSPSMRVSTMPVRPTRSSKRAREIDRVLAGQAVGDQQHFVRIGGAS